jgi:uncharacterized protein UPF0158
VKAIVQLRAVMEGIDLPDEMEAFLDPKTGEIEVVGEDDRWALEDGDGVDEGGLELPEWQRESIAKLRELLDSGRALALPAKFDFHEWEVMRQFAGAVEDDEERMDLLNAIHGPGAFRNFKAGIARLGVREKWFEYRDAALRELAREWLEENGIEYAEEAATEG